MATLQQSASGDVTVLHVIGSLTQDGVERVASPFEAATPGAGRVVVDLSQVPLMTTPGITLLLTAARRSQAAGGRLVLASATRSVDDLLRRCRLDSVLDAAPTLPEALRRVGQ